MRKVAIRNTTALVLMAMVLLGGKSGTVAADDFGTPAGTAKIAAAAGFVDVVGVKLGMPVKDALAALKAHNPKMTFPPLGGVRTDLLPNVEFVLGSLGSFQEGLINESIQLSFTAQPNVAVVWGVQRQIMYPPNARPTVENTIAALRKKFGPESGRMETRPVQLSVWGVDMIDAYWVFDANGKQLPLKEAADFFKACSDYLARFQRGDGSFMGNYDFDRWERNGTKTNCGSNTLVRANWMPTDPRAETKGLVTTLILQARNGLLHRSATDASAKMVQQAAENKENKEKKDASKVGAPKL